MTCFSRTKAIPPSLLNACDYVFQFNFERAHIAGSINLATDSLSRPKLKVRDKIYLKFREDVHTTTIELTIYSSDVADEEQCFSPKEMTKMRPKGKPLKRKKILKESHRKTNKWHVSPTKPSIKECTKSTETIRRTLWIEMRQMHGYE